jgi:hypothetical protein
MVARALPEWIDNVSAATQLALALPRFLRRRVTVEAAAAAQRQRRETRDAAWLALVRAAVYENPRSPYLRLLRRAGCELGDLEGLVRRSGLEATLHHLYRAGVYLTIEEFKGRRPVVRGHEQFVVRPGALRNPCSAVHAFVRSGGSRGPGTAVPIDLAFLREQSTNTCLVVHARGGATWHKGHWTVPGGGALNMVLTYATFGRLPTAWFSQLEPDSATIPARYRWSARLVCQWSRLIGCPIPSPRHVPLEDPAPILRWMTEVLRSGEVPLLQTFTSSAVRVCQAAREAGVELRGAQFTLGGEPVTAARLAILREVGAVGYTHYGAAETGSALSLGCLDPVQPDDSHLTDDLHAFVQPGQASPSRDLSPRALLITSLRMRAPLVFLNVSLGDEAIVDRRTCGCRLEEHGWRTHVHTIRSFEKLTAGGMTFLDVDAIRVLEEVLPARFGGSPADYQLVEEERPDGRSRLLLLVHPAVGAADGRLIADVFLEALGRGEEAKHVMAHAWRQAGLLEVERRPPIVTGAGKILHLHRMGRARASQPDRKAAGAAAVDRG